MPWGFLHNLNRGLRDRGVLPELDSPIDRITVCSEHDVRGKVLHQLGVAPAK